MFWCGWSSPFPKALWQPELLSPPCQWGTISFVTAQARSSGAKGTLPWTQHLVQLASTDPFTGAILYSLQRSNPTNQLDPWEKFFLKAHIWWCNLLREDHCAPIWGCRKEKLPSAVFWTLLSFCCYGWVKKPDLSLLLFAWKEQRCGQKTQLVEYPFTPGSEPVFSQLFGWLEKKKGSQGWGLPQVPSLFSFSIFSFTCSLWKGNTLTNIMKDSITPQQFSCRELKWSFPPFLLCCLWKQGQKSHCFWQS